MPEICLGCHVQGEWWSICGLLLSLTFLSLLDTFLWCSGSLCCRLSNRCSFRVDLLGHYLAELLLLLGLFLLTLGFLACYFILSVLQQLFVALQEVLESITFSVGHLKTRFKYIVSVVPVLKPIIYELKDHPESHKELEGEEEKLKEELYGDDGYLAPAEHHLCFQVWNKVSVEYHVNENSHDQELFDHDHSAQALVLQWLATDVQVHGEVQDVHY